MIPNEFSDFEGQHQFPDVCGLELFLCACKILEFLFLSRVFTFVVKENGSDLDEDILLSLL